MIRKDDIPVLTACAVDPGANRRSMTVSQGSTVGEIVATALPGATSAELRQCRVSLVTEQGVMIVERGKWHCVRPHTGVQVVIRLIPAKNALRAVLTIVIAVAAVALGAHFGLAFGAVGSPGYALASSAITLGVPIVGTVVINSLMRVTDPKAQRRTAIYDGSRRPKSRIPAN